MLKVFFYFRNQADTWKKAISFHSQRNWFNSTLFHQQLPLCRPVQSVLHASARANKANGYLETKVRWQLVARQPSHDGKDRLTVEYSFWRSAEKLLGSHDESKANKREKDAQEKRAAGPNTAQYFLSLQQLHNVMRRFEGYITGTNILLTLEKSAHWNSVQIYKKIKKIRLQYIQ